MTQTYFRVQTADRDASDLLDPGYQYSHAYNGNTALTRPSVSVCVSLDDPFGGYEEHHFLRIRHQIRRARGTCWGAGFKAMAQAGAIENLPWWPKEGL